jgi:hypothetical protein
LACRSRSRSALWSARMPEDCLGITASPFAPSPGHHRQLVIRLPYRSRSGPSLRFGRQGFDRSLRPLIR